MQEYTFEVTQCGMAFFVGKLKVQANSIDEARSIIENSSQEKLEDMCDEWQLMPNGEPDGPIEVWDGDGELIV